MSEKIKPFKFYDGDTGTSYTVTDIIEDGKTGFAIDQDEMDLIRHGGEGGIDPEEHKRRYEKVEGDKSTKKKARSRGRRFDKKHR